MSPPTTLPASWFCSAPLYQLERRAIFLKAWHFLGPVTRFQSRTEKVIYEIAQIKLIIENRSPENDGVDMEGINVYAEEMGREIKSHITATGLLFATLSMNAPPFQDYFKGLEDLTNAVDFTKLPYRRTISYYGNFNWKTMIDGYQECLHCSFTHPAFTKLYPPTTYAVTNHSNFCQHLADPNKTSLDDGLFLYFFPVTTLNVYGGGMSSLRVCPGGEEGDVDGMNVGRSRIEFDYYHSGSDEEFEKYFKFVRQVAIEDFELCEVAQKNLEAGVYRQGILNPLKESGVIFYQGRVRDEVRKQFELEERLE